MKQARLVVLICFLLILSPVTLAISSNDAKSYTSLDVFAGVGEFLQQVADKIFSEPTGFATAAYQISTKAENFTVSDVQCTTDLKVLVQSRSKSNLYIAITVKPSVGSNRQIFTDQMLNSLQSAWITAKPGVDCKDIVIVGVNGYSKTTATKTFYTNNEPVYLLTSTASQPTATQQVITEATNVQTPAQPEVNSVQETAASPTGTSYVYLGRKLIERIDQDGGEYYFHEDQLGSTTLVTDSSGKKVSENSYDPFGRDLAAQSAISNDIKFTGKEQDKSSLYYYGARYYDPEIGRFTQVDPAVNPIESSYSYADNNPINKVDPTGAVANSPDASYVDPEIPRRNWENQFLKNIQKYKNQAEVEKTMRSHYDKFFVTPHIEANAFRDAAIGYIPCERALSFMGKLFSRIIGKETSNLITVTIFETFGKRETGDLTIKAVRSQLSASEFNAYLRPGDTSQLMFKEATGEYGILMPEGVDGRAFTSHLDAGIGMREVEGEWTGFYILKNGRDEAIEGVIGGSSYDQMVGLKSTTDIERIGARVRSDLGRFGIRFNERFEWGLVGTNPEGTSVFGDLTKTGSVEWRSQYGQGKRP